VIIFPANLFNGAEHPALPTNLCGAVDTHRDSQASILRGSSECLEHTIPNDICNASSLSTFRAKLKTHFFTVAYSRWTYPPPGSVFTSRHLHYRCDINLFYVTLYYNHFIIIMTWQ